MILTATISALRRARRRLAGEAGFTMLIALGILSVTTLLITATLVATQGDTQLGQHDLDGKRAYLAARAAMNTFLYQLNQNPNYWQTCPNDTAALTAVPGSTTGEKFSYHPIYNPAQNVGTCPNNPIAALVDPSTGTLRIAFTGYSGAPDSTGTPKVQRGIVASFRKDSPLDFVWYTVYESSDPGTDATRYASCKAWYRDKTRSSNCDINWVSGDSIKGPMYTKDQYLVSSAKPAPTFGRDKNDSIESWAPGTSNSAICAGNNCRSAVINGTPLPNARDISPPSDNSKLYVDATLHGRTFSGTTTIALNNDGTASVTSCPGTTPDPSTCVTQTPLNTAQTQIIYVTNAPGCIPPGYSPFGATYPATTPTVAHPTPSYYGCAGNVYVSGSYSSGFTIAAANDIIIDGSISTSEDNLGTPTGGATLGLVANDFVRVMHGYTPRSGSSSGNCGTGKDVAGQTFPGIKIDAAILALAHSFTVDNFDCGAQLGNLNISGAIAQFFRGPVGTTGTGTGYLKNYSYDNRLHVLLPPFLFDIATSGWHSVRETLCFPTPADCS